MSTSHNDYSLKVSMWFYMLCSIAGTLSCQKLEEHSTQTPFSELPITNTPNIFYEGVVSTHIDKYNTSFSADGNTIYYTITHRESGLTGLASQTFVNGTFTSPLLLPFNTSEAPLTDVQISPDGNLLMCSTFMDYTGKPQGFNFNLWYSDRLDGVWSDPKPFGNPIQSTGNEFYPVMVKDRSIYFVSDRNGNSDIYKSSFVNGAYHKPEPLPIPINTSGMEADAFVDPDEQYIIFVRWEAEDGLGKSDLYISFLKENTHWSNPVHMGSEINSPEIDGSPYVTSDQKFLIFTSGRNRDIDRTEAIRNFSLFESIQIDSSLNFYYVAFSPDQFR